MQQGQFELPANVEIIQDDQVISPDEVSASRAANLNWLMQAAAAGQLVQIRKLLATWMEKNSFQGVMDPRQLDVTDQEQFAEFGYPLVNGFIINDGPNPVLIAINQNQKWQRMLEKETRTLNYFGADEKVSCIFYRCETGMLASVRVEGIY